MRPVTLRVVMVLILLLGLCEEDEDCIIFTDADVDAVAAILITIYVTLAIYCLLCFCAPICKYCGLGTFLTAVISNL